MPYLLSWFLSIAPEDFKYLQRNLKYRQTSKKPATRWIIALSWKLMLNKITAIDSKTLLQASLKLKLKKKDIG